MYYIKWGEFYVRMLLGYVSVHKEPLAFHGDLEDAQDEAVKIAKFLGQTVNSYRWEDATFAGLLRAALVPRVTS